MADAVHKFDNAGSANQSIAAASHGSRSGATFNPGQRDVIPFLTVGARDDTAVNGIIVEDRPLLDVQFKEGMYRPLPHRRLARESDPAQLVPESLALRVAYGECLVEAEHAGEHTRGRHGGSKPRSLL